uniref:Helicase ATP-binding domain-containing protein n=1 Tax=Strongyloides papillosus TaxID=174720 RepID=A0A0N5BM82_STREA
MSTNLPSFSEFNLESELVHNLEKLNKKVATGPQKQLIEVLMEKNSDVILRARKQSEMSMGYLIPMINEGIVRKKCNDSRKCVGLIITWSSEEVKSITKIAKEICEGLPISVMSCPKKRLTLDGENDGENEYVIIVTKAVVLLKNIPNFEELSKSLSYVVVEEALFFSFVDKNKYLVDIFKVIRNAGNNSVTTILISDDFRGNENKLEEQFLQKPLTKISLFGIGLEKHFKAKEANGIGCLNTR